MKKISVCFVALALTACTATPQDQDYDMRMVQAALPDGCTLHYAGEVRVADRSEDRPSRVFFVNCKDTVTTSETHSVSQGKTTVDQNNVTVIRK